MLREYLLLIRVPNLFTVPSNIVAGYFAVIPVCFAESGQLLSLILSSILLYVSGIVLNDYFDIDIDRKERQGRPLASGRITKRNALILAAMSIVLGNFFASVVSWTSLLVSILITSVIIAYDFRLKHNQITSPLSIGLSRFLNVMLGGSPALGVALLTLQDHSLLIFISICVFLHTVAISLLSRKEIDNTRLFHIRHYRMPLLLSFLIVLIIIISILVAGFLGSFQILFVFNLVIYSCVVIFTLIRLIVTLRSLDMKAGGLERKEAYHLRLSRENCNDSLLVSQKVQTTVKIMILSIVILDSVFISGLVGITAGMATLLLLGPPIYLGRRLYIT